MASGQSGMAVAALWAQTARLLHGHDSVDATLLAVVDLARSVVGSGEHAGVTVLHAPGVIDSPAFTDPLVRRLDQLQQDSDQGPCLEAMRGQEIVRVDDMAADARWPAFGREAVALGVVSMLSCRISTGRGPGTALNLHAGSRGAFDDQAVQTAAIYAAHAALALANAGRVESVRRSMEDRSRIGEATGILMERHKITSRQAFSLLVEASQRLNAKVRDIALRVVETGQEPSTIRQRHLDGT